MIKFIVSSNTLLKNLQAIGGVLSTNSTLPILDNFLFKLEKDSLKVTASDIQTTMTVDVPLVMSDGDGKIAIPAKILLDTLKTFSDIPISFFIDLQSFAIELSTDEGKYKLSGFDGDEFPAAPILENTSRIEISAEALENAIVKTVFATGNDEMRPVMAGVNFEFTSKGLIFVATDAHKLVKYVRKDVVSTSEDSFIMPKKPLNQLKNVLANKQMMVTLDYNKVNAHFTFGNMSLICRLVEGKYPNYEAVIPKENPNKLIIDRTQLLNAIRRVSIFANQSTNQIRFEIIGQELTLSAEDLDYTNEANERLSCNFEGNDIVIGFNSKFIIEMLNNLNVSQMQLELSTPNRAGIILPITDHDDVEEILMLVMPVMLNS